VAKRRKGNTKSSSGKEPYDVGYGRPPRHTQFKPGQSGNPAGRRKGLRNFKTDVLSILEKPLKVREGGRTRTRSTQEATLMMIRNKACQGHDRSIERICDLALRFNNDAGETGESQPLPADDRAILDAYVAEVTAAATRPPSTEASDESTDVGPKQEISR
jgi:Family of unknown function (DUF5681)